MLMTQGDNKHYVMIKYFNTFIQNQTKSHHTKHFCMYCLQCFTSQYVINRHKDNFIVIKGEQAIKMPKTVKPLNFKIIINNCKHCLLYTLISRQITEKLLGCKPNKSGSYTEAYQKAQ